MKDDVREVLRDQVLIEARERQLGRLTDFFQGRYSTVPFGLSGVGPIRSISSDEVNDSLMESVCDELAACARCILDEQVFRPVSVELWLYGVHFVDRIFGAELGYSKDSHVWWSDGVNNEIGRLEPPDFAHNNLWQKTTQLYSTLINRVGSLPLIGTQVLGSPMVGIFNLYREDLLCAFYDKPDAVKHDLRILTDALKFMHHWFLASIPKEQLQPVCIGGRCQPRGFGQMCGCTTQLISKQTYDEFIAPLDREILGVYPYGGLYHLCGTHAQHIPTWSAMRELRAVQLNDRAADDFELYFQGLREDQIIYLNPSADMSIERALEISGGRRLVLIGDPDHIKGYQTCGC